MFSIIFFIAILIFEFNYIDSIIYINLINSLVQASPFLIIDALKNNSSVFFSIFYKVSRSVVNYVFNNILTIGFFVKNYFTLLTDGRYPTPPAPPLHITNHVWNLLPPPLLPYSLKRLLVKCFQCIYVNRPKDNKSKAFSTLLNWVMNTYSTFFQKYQLFKLPQ